jgi:type I restriction enzyme S subunit
MEVRPGYRQTEAGVIPDDWEAKTIDAVAFVTSGKRLPLGCSLTNQETEHPYIRVTDMRPGTVSLSDIKFVPVDVFAAIKRYCIFKEDIFISVAGTLGIVGKVPAELDGANLTENADRITNITCSQDYLLHVLMSPLIQNTVDSLRTVGAQPKLALTRIRKFVIPLPPTTVEQEAIAQALSDADAHIDSLEQIIAKKRHIKQGAMRELLTGKRRLPGFVVKKDYKQTEVGLIPEEWGTMRLQSLLSQPATYGVVKAGIYQRRGIPMLRGGDIKDGRVNTGLPLIGLEKSAEYQRTVLRNGDVVIALVGYPGEAAVIPEALGGANISRAVGLLRPSNALNAGFLTCYLNSSSGRKEFLKPGAGSAQMVVNLRDLNLLWIPLPPSKAEQRAIAEALSDVDAEIGALEAKLVKARQIKQGMMQELLTGRIRLL